jgi:hypothetical protein
MPMLLVHVSSAVVHYACPCCMSKLYIQAACRNAMSMLLVQAARQSCTSVLHTCVMFVHAAYPFFMSMSTPACQCCMFTLHAAWTC